MKRLIIIVVSLWLTSMVVPGFGQEYKKQIGTDQQVQLILNKGKIKVEGYNGKEIAIKAIHYEQPPKRAKGLRPLYNNAQDNTGIGLSVTEKAGAILIQEASKEGEYIIRLPENIRLSVEQLNWGGEDIEVRNMKSEIEVKAKNANVRLLDVEGPIVANSTSGEIEIVYSSLKPDVANLISVVSSEVDITLPANSKASLKLKSITGEIYTDLDMQMKQQEKDGKQMRYVGGGKTIEGTINGGGSTEVSIQTVSSNIYLRKAQ